MFKSESELLEKEVKETKLSQKILDYALSGILLKHEAHLKLEGNLFHCFGTSFSLKSKKQMIKLFEIFMAHDFCELTKRQVIELVHPNYKGFGSRRSDIFVEFSVIKSISRARLYAEKNMPSYKGHKIHWFYYDSYRKTWQFFKFDNF